MERAVSTHTHTQKGGGGLGNFFLLNVQFQPRSCTLLLQLLPRVTRRDTLEEAVGHGRDTAEEGQEISVSIQEGPATNLSFSDFSLFLITGDSPFPRIYRRGKWRIQKWHPQQCDHNSSSNMLICSTCSARITMLNLKHANWDFNGPNCGNQDGGGGQVNSQDPFPRCPPLPPLVNPLTTVTALELV